MDKRLRNRTLFIVLVMVASLLGIIGFPRNVDQLKENVRNRIKLGLDLKGGAHLILQVMVDDAVRVTRDRAMDRIRDEMKVKNIPYLDLLPCSGAASCADPQKREADTTHIFITFPKDTPQSKFADLQDLVKAQFSDWDLVQAGDPNSRVLSLKVSSVATIRNQALDQSINTIRNRVDQYGVIEPEIAEYGQGDFELVVQLPGVDDLTRVMDLIQTTALLEFKIVQDGPYSSKEAALSAHGGILPPDTVLVPGKETQNGQAWYILNRIAAVTGSDLTGAQASRDAEGPDVNFTLTRDGAVRFERVTEANIDRLLAIVLDNRVIDAPAIKGKIRDNGVIHGGSMTPEYCADLALKLRSGALPASIRTLSEATVGPSLGLDSIRHGVVASLVGFVGVMAFMLFYYRGSGINANLALILNLLILVAVLAYFEAVLTLPGIAGVILTVGMGVDSNVLIFERIREELRAGKAVGAAVSGGFEHAFKTIIDTHVTTVVSAAILFTFGTGPIRGFAVTLTIGLIANLFTSVFVSRTIFDYLLTRRVKGEALSI